MSKQVVFDIILVLAGFITLFEIGRKYRPLFES
jgi:hypothetical protein